MNVLSGETAKKIMDIGERAAIAAIQNRVVPGEHRQPARVQGTSTGSILTDMRVYRAMAFETFRVSNLIPSDGAS
jgi:hypothetical protein